MQKSKELIAVLLLCIFWVAACSNNNNDITIEELSLTDRIVLLIQKQYEFANFELDYNIYEDMYSKLFADNYDINEEVYTKYRPDDSSELVDLTYKEFDGMKAKEIKEYIKEKGVFFRKREIESHEFEVSQEYEDDELDWKYIIVKETIIGDFGEAYYTYRYTFENQGDEYKVIMVDSDKRVAFHADDLANMSEEEKVKWINMSKYLKFQDEPVFFLQKFDFKS